MTVEDRLRAGALELFLDRGYDAVTVKDIADRAGVTSRTFFRYFPTKETVIIDIADHTNSRLLEIIRSVPSAGTVPELLTTAVTLWFAEFAQIFPVLAELVSRSQNVSATLALHSASWARRIGEAISERIPLRAAGSARIWGLITYSILELTNEAIEENGWDYLTAVPRVIGAFAEEVGDFTL